MVLSNLEHPQKVSHLDFPLQDQTVKRKYEESPNPRGTSPFNTVQYDSVANRPYQIFEKRSSTSSLGPTTVRRSTDSRQLQNTIAVPMIQRASKIVKEENRQKYTKIMK